MSEKSSKERNIQELLTYMHDVYVNKDPSPLIKIFRLLSGMSQGSKILGGGGPPDTPLATHSVGVLRFYFLKLYHLFSCRIIGFQN